MPASAGRNESVTLASNQQIIPALQPQSSTPFSQAPRRIVSNPWTRHTASAFAVFPPESTSSSNAVPREKPPIARMRLGTSRVSPYVVRGSPATLRRAMVLGEPSRSEWKGNLLELSPPD